ncbi:DNA gyrase inhibitor YacG [Roseospirillum parvum]|uniref:DNA gyrase inhibitor YacG n=1 Tax=Roseospirillum parvum TaxID=83401 RepID=A0A1G7VXR7_9PROT|nr:DNA gyrase inhibitor YacG [Roseospirillum parvum]SDG64517.1 hypothetical protein SAMN05421742_1026 [Roseospirillum parvum]
MSQPPEAVRVAPKACPLCGKPVVPRYRPFCSQRCAEVDLGHWLTETYRIPDDSLDPDEE